MGPSTEVKELTLDSNKDSKVTLFFGEKAKSVGASAGRSGGIFGGGMLRPPRSGRGLVGAEIQLKSRSSANQAVRPHQPGRRAPFLIAAPGGLVPFSSPMHHTTHTYLSQSALGTAYASLGWKR